MSALKLTAIVMFVVSVVLAVITGSLGSPVLWAVWSGVVLIVFGGVVP